jgi:dTDP-glucose 4,6-dehydratase
VRIIVTGGAGFIGSSLVEILLAAGDEVITVDALTYAGRLESLAAVFEHPRHRFQHMDICDSVAVRRLLSETRPDGIINLAAETHVDRSIEDPSAFVRTNVLGTVNLLDAVLNHQRQTGERIRFHHVSTDEVFGSLGANGAFSESSPYDPRSPYSASKAASDHFVRAYHHTYGLASVISNCSNNYGPRQFPEKLIPHMIARALDGRSLPVYGAGTNVRDWIYVGDHARALEAVFKEGTAGRTYLIGGRSERSNLAVVQEICALLDRLVPDSPHVPHARLIEFVEDRPGHDFRYAIDPTSAADLGWEPSVSFEQGLERTVRWYLANEDWWRPLVEGGEATVRRGLLGSEGRR